MDQTRGCCWSDLSGEYFSTCRTWSPCFISPRYRQGSKVFVPCPQPKVWGFAFLRNTPIVYQVYESLRITEDDPNLKIRELFCGANVRAWLCRKWLERAWWIAVCHSLDLFVLREQLPWGYQGSLADGQEYACSENSWKNWANTQKELRITFPGGFCLNNIQNGDPFPTEDSNLLPLPFQDG